MTRKQLPKAIRRTDEDLRGITSGGVADEEARARRSTLSAKAFEAEPAPTAFSRAAANDQFPTALIYAGPQAAKRRLLARKIVERYKMYAAMGGLLPLPIFNVAGVTAVILRMVKQLSDLYAVPFERDRTRSIIVSLVGGTVPTGLGVTTASTLAPVIPGSGLLGLAVSAITAGALTRGIGLVFVEHFETAAMPLGAAQTEPA